MRIVNHSERRYNDNGDQDETNDKSLTPAFIHSFIHSAVESVVVLLLNGRPGI